MVKEVIFAIVIFKILDYRSIVDVSFQKFDVVFNVFRFVGDWEIEGIVA